MSSGLTMSGIDAIREMLSESAVVRTWLGVATAEAALERIYRHWVPDEEDSLTLEERKALRPWICVMSGGAYQINSSGVHSAGRMYCSVRVMYERVAADEVDANDDFSAFNDEVDSMNQGVIANQQLATVVDIMHAPQGQPMRYEESQLYSEPGDTGRPESLVVFAACFEMRLGGAG